MITRSSVLACRRTIDANRMIADMGPVPSAQHAVVRPVGSVTVTVPEVATTARDGLAAVLRPGRTRLDVAVLLNRYAQARGAQLEVNGAACPVVALPPGAVVRLPCLFQARPHSRVTVRVVSDGAVVATWHHTVR